MLQDTLSSWNKKRLRIILVLFFLALAIPTAILINQAYNQLKWEAFHHYRLQAEELSKRIDLRYSELIETESARPFTDYSFLNVTGNNQSGFLQRSPLSTYPVNTKFPGVIGYFQIDNNGQFSTPLLPPVAAEQLSSLQNYGLTKTEKVKRNTSQDQIYRILSQNRLINKPAAKRIEKEASGLASGKTPGIESKKLELTDSLASSQSVAPAPAEAALSTDTIKPQVAFDKLQSKSAYSSTVKSDLYSQKRQRVEDLKLKKTFERNERQQRQEKISRFKEKKQFSRRKESSALPVYPSLLKENRVQIKNNAVNMFESEVDAFEFSLLKSGHFVLYRKVWRNGLRYIQGLLIKPDIFINNVIAKSFYETSVSTASNLTIAYQGNVLSTLNSKPSRNFYSSQVISRRNSPLQGTLLLQNRLSPALEKIELVFSINNLPAGPGATVIIWLSVILLLILCGGFLILYILGIKQITLARQQQDFVSAVSHELKTPLTSIRMYGEMLREGWTSNEKRQQYYNYIYDESERLTRLINNVLQLARMTRNELPVDLKSHTVAELLDTVRSKISSQVEGAEFKLTLTCNEEVKEKTLLADIDYFTQIMINLVDNAIKFSAKAEKKQIDIRCEVSRNNKIQFSIRDYGPGINKDQMKKIFQLFYRSENELTRETVGTGIGLSLVKQLAKSMRAKIDIVNKQPGTEFQITFNLS